jgi:hypothetical protein
MDWAQINSNNKVVNIIVADHEEIESRAKDEFTYVESNLENMADIGGFYFPDTNTFSVAQPFDSWVFNHEQRAWIPPKPKPSEEILTKHFLDGTPYEIPRWIWNEEIGEWIEQ